MLVVSLEVSAFEYEERLHTCSQNTGLLAPDFRSERLPTSRTATAGGLETGDRPFYLVCERCVMRSWRSVVGR